MTCFIICIVACVMLHLSFYVVFYIMSCRVVSCRVVSCRVVSYCATCAQCLNKIIDLFIVFFLVDGVVIFALFATIPMVVFTALWCFICKRRNLLAKP